MKNTLINRIATKKIATALAGINQNVVYVGGAVVSLYIDDPSADDVRPTKDIDIAMEIANVVELEAIREELQQRGFYQSHEDNVICRFRYEDIKVDIMATKEVGWAPANPWFAPGYKNVITFNLDGIVIQCLPLPYYLATKFSAFYDRGSIDPRTSKDFEDIVYLLNYTTTLTKLILQSDDKVRNYLITCFKDILNDSVKREAILGNLFYEDQEIRYEKIINTIKEICDGI